MKAEIFTADDCKSLYNHGEPYGDEHPNGWQDMADRLNRIASERIAGYIGRIDAIDRMGLE